jgi:hypothetical protein
MRLKGPMNLTVDRAIGLEVPIAVIPPRDEVIG